ncbi:hypothetical protein GCK72_002760 [Caenorhabditis remanei]|nr:hypothetical protein GCK72_002760 [Caenorhabditis remanei]KAF1770936.1 hypothetical protein GCK72_002760 [Caenorhabditis remanei]
MHRQNCCYNPDSRGIPTVPPPFAFFVAHFEGAYPRTVNGSRLELRSFPGSPIGDFRRRYPSSFATNMMLTEQDKNAEHNDENTRQSRSPSVDSVSRLHQQSGGFASQNQQQNSQSQQPTQQRRGSFSKDGGGNGGYYQQQNQNGYRRQSFSQRGNRSNNQRSGSSYQGEQLGNNYQQGYQLKQQRAYQNYPQHQSKYFYQPRPIFNSTQEFGPFSARRQSPSSPSSPTPSATNSSSNRNQIPPPPILLRHVESLPHEKGFSGSGSEQEQHHDAKIHQYRSAGTAPGGFSNNSSPFKQQTPTTPSSSEKRGEPEEWPTRFQHPPPGLQNPFRRPHDNIPPPIELQRKNPVASLPIDIPPNSQPSTPSSFERNAQFRAAIKEGVSVDSVDAKHACFANERMHSAIYG